MGVGPGQDLLLGQWWELIAVAFALIFGQELGERSTSGKIPETLLQGIIDVLPGFASCVRNDAGLACRARPGALVVGVGPGQDLGFGEGRQIQKVAHAAPLGQELRHGRAAGKVALPLAQGRVDLEPCLEDGAGDAAAAARRPFAGGRVVNVGPHEDLSHVEWAHEKLPSPGGTNDHGNV